MQEDNYQAKLINTYDPAIKSKLQDSWWVQFLMGAIMSAVALAIIALIGACVR